MRHPCNKCAFKDWFVWPRGPGRPWPDPLSEDQRKKLQTTVERGLVQVRDILARHGQALEQLPEPTQRAHRFLAAIDWPRVPASPFAVQTPRRSVGTVQLSGLASAADGMMHRLSRPEVIPGASDHVYEDILTWNHIIDGVIRKGSIPPEQLTPQSWSARVGWRTWPRGRTSRSTERPSPWPCRFWNNAPGTWATLTITSTCTFAPCGASTGCKRIDSPRNTVDRPGCRRVFGVGPIGLWP